MVAVDEVALAERAAGEELDGVDATHVGLDDGHDLFVGGVRSDLGQRDLCGAHPHREPGAHVPVERDDVGESLFVDHASSALALVGAACSDDDEADTSADSTVAGTNGGTGGATISRTAVDDLDAKTAPTPGQVKAAIERVRHASQRSEALIGGLLLLARTDAELTDAVALDLADIAASVLEELEPQRRTADVLIDVGLDPAPASGDPSSSNDS